MDDYLKFKRPFTSIIIGTSGPGKSIFCIRFLQNIDSLFTEKYLDGGINLCYCKRTAVPTEQLTVLCKYIRFKECVLENLENKNGKPCLIILGNLLNDVYCKELCNLFIKGSHH